jgi:hypothetical protein
MHTYTYVDKYCQYSILSSEICNKERCITRAPCMCKCTFHWAASSFFVPDPNAAVPGEFVHWISPTAICQNINICGENMVE